MKTSNKLLIGTFLLVISFLLLLHFSLFSKFKQHKFESEEQLISSFFSVHSLPAIHYISLTNVRAYIRPSKNSKLGINSANDGNINFHISKDSLFVEGNSPYHDNIEFTSDPVLNRVQLWLPENLFIRIKESQVQLKGSPDSIGSKSFIIHLEEGSLILGDFLFVDSSDSYFKNIVVTEARKSQIVLSSRIDSMDVNLTKSLLNDWGAKINFLSLKADDSSNLSLNGKNFPQGLKTNSLFKIIVPKNN
jgi:hypothetical protein